MTLHADQDYRCASCGATYVPFRNPDPCPRCGAEASKVFPNFVAATLSSAQYNIARYESVIPPAWLSSTIGDEYFNWAFRFLAYAASSLEISEESLWEKPIPENDAIQMANDFLAHFNFGEHSYLSKHFRPYFTELLNEKWIALFKESKE